MLCVLWVGEDLLGELEAVLVLLLLVAFLKGQEKDLKSCNRAGHPAASHQDPLEECVLLGRQGLVVLRRLTSALAGGGPRRAAGRRHARDDGGGLQRRIRSIPDSRIRRGGADKRTACSKRGGQDAA